MNDNFRQVGQMFREKREELGMSIKEVESSTSIRGAYLQSIEEGNVAGFLSGVYALGFMKQYAAFLGIDLDRMIKENPAGFKMPSEKHDFSFGIGTLEMRKTAGGGVKWLPSLMWAALGGGVLGLAWILAKAVGLL